MPNNKKRLMIASVIELISDFHETVKTGIDESIDLVDNPGLFIADDRKAFLKMGKDFYSIMVSIELTIKPIELNEIKK